MDLKSVENSDVNVINQASLSEYTTFRLGGSCNALLHCQTPNQLHKAVALCHQKKIKFILIGGGSNLVVSDEGVDCHVIRYVSDVPLIQRHGHELLVTASTSLDQLAQYAVDNSLEGLNCTTGIPGTVGGAIVGNAGAFGKQIGDVVKSIKVIYRDRTCAIPTVENLDSKDLNFTYRNSNLKKTDDIVVSARFTLKPGNKAALKKERDEILSVRRSKHPDLSKNPCAGSFFRNIEPTSSAQKRQAAGWFLEQAGGKRLIEGGAKIYKKHANIIIKSNQCSSQDVYELSNKMEKLVREKFGLELIREVRFVGNFDGMPTQTSGIIW